MWSFVTFCKISSSFTYIVAAISNSLLFTLNNIAFYEYTIICFSIIQLMDMWVASIFLAIMNIHVQVFV